LPTTGGISSRRVASRCRRDSHISTAHLVPGIEYALSNDVDVVAEVGVGLHDDSSNCVSAGIAYYLR
jgi:hypothetical protein